MRCPRGVAAAAPTTPVPPPAGTAATTGTASTLPVCLPGQEPSTVSGSGTPAPLGNLQGIPADVKSGGTFGGVPLNGNQIDMAATIVAVGKQMGITRRGIEIGLSVATEQSSLRPEALNKDWLGLFQQNPDEYTQYRRTEPGGASWMFYDRLLKLVPNYDTDPRENYEIGDVVQKTTTGERFADYQQMATDLAGKLIDAVSLQQDDVTCTPAPAAAETTGSVFDPGNIVSDQVFYNSKAMTVDQIRIFIRAEGEGCTGPYCLKNLAVTTTDQPADRYCAAYDGAADEDAAAVISKVSTACGVNPQVMLVTLQKESALLNRTDPSASTYDAAWGWHCPDTGPGGSANCDPEHAGFFNQGYGMAKQWSRYRLDPDKYNYRAGQTADIMWNVAESKCGSAPVTIKNQATAALYNYTPYQPNAAALAAYPGVGDRCSTYGNRNFFYLFRKYFGSTGGGTSTTAGAAAANGTTVTIPKSPYVSAALAGQQITAPNAAVASGLAAGFSALGMPYVWGGGGSGAGPNNGCARGGGDYNSCGTEVGFDCSGLTAYVLGMAGYRTPGDSGAQRAAGESISWAQALPGDIVGFPGHVAVYLGTFGGRPYILEASWVGTPIHVVPLTRTDFDDRVHRYWTGPAVSAPKAADFSAIVRSYSGVPMVTYEAPDTGSSGDVLIGTRTYSATIQRIRPRPWPAPVFAEPQVAPPPQATSPETRQAAVDEPKPARQVADPVDRAPTRASTPSRPAAPAAATTAAPTTSRPAPTSTAPRPGKPGSSTGRPTTPAAAGSTSAVPTTKATPSSSSPAAGTTSAAGTTTQQTSTEPTTSAAPATTPVTTSPRSTTPPSTTAAPTTAPTTTFASTFTTPSTTTAPPTTPPLITPPATPPSSTTPSSTTPPATTPPSAGDTTASSTAPSPSNTTASPTDPVDPTHTTDPAVPMCTLPEGTDPVDVDGEPLLNYVEIDPDAVPAQHPELPSCLPETDSSAPATTAGP